MNALLLSHLIYYVRLLRLLWTHSAFAFEGQMGTYVRSSHATHGIVHQVNSLYIQVSHLKIYVYRDYIYTTKIFFKRLFFLYSPCHYMRAWIRLLDVPGCYERAAQAERSQHYKVQDCSELWGRVHEEWS